MSTFGKNGYEKWHLGCRNKNSETTLAQFCQGRFWLKKNTKCSNKNTKVLSSIMCDRGVCLTPTSINVFTPASSSSTLSSSSGVRRFIYEKDQDKDVGDEDDDDDVVIWERACGRCAGVDFRER